MGLRIGKIRIDWLDGGTFGLDGGAMFGVVPKVLWSKKYPVDEENFIPMVSWPLLIRTGDANIVVEGGIGPRLTEKQQRNFRVRKPWRVPEALREFGLTPEDIDVVIMTHGDWDHISGLTSLGPDGSPRVTFPRARHIIQASEWHDVRHPNRRSIHGYWPENWHTLDAAGVVHTVEGAAEIVPGVEVIHTGGHTRGHQMVLIRSEGEGALHMADLLPTHAHLNPLWVMAYDNYPLDSIERKAEWIQRAQEEGWWLTFYHDTLMLAGKWDTEGNLVDSIPTPKQG